MGKATTVSMAQESAIAAINTIAQAVKPVEPALEVLKSRYERLVDQVEELTDALATEKTKHTEDVNRAAGAMAKLEAEYAALKVKHDGMKSIIRDRLDA